MRPLAPPLLAAVLLAALPAAPLRAGPLSDYVLAPGAFAPPTWEAREGPLAYRHERRGPREDGAVAETLTLDGVRRGTGLRLVLARAAENGPGQEVTDFSPNAANPVVLFFLETTARAMAEATGGSPFYIRNRIREALGAAPLGTAGKVAHGAADVDVQEVTLRPFAADANRARMGDFAELAITFTLAPALPGRILALSADTPDPASGYHERLTLMPEDP